MKLTIFSSNEVREKKFRREEKRWAEGEDLKEEGGGGALAVTQKWAAGQAGATLEKGEKCRTRWALSFASASALNPIPARKQPIDVPKWGHRTATSCN